MQRIAYCAALIGAIALTACSGGTTTTPCVPFTGLIPAFMMVYPAPGATAVPDTLSGIYFEGQEQPNTSIALSANGSTVAKIGALTASPSPLPAGVTANYEAPLPQSLAAATTYTVLWTFTPPSGSTCTPGTVTQTLGTFTTQ